MFDVHHGGYGYDDDHHHYEHDADDDDDHYEHDAGDNAGGRLSAGALSASSLVARLTPFELLRISESTQQCIVKLNTLLHSTRVHYSEYPTCIKYNCTLHHRCTATCMK